MKQVDQKPMKFFSQLRINETGLFEQDGATLRDRVKNWVFVPNAQMPSGCLVLRASTFLHF